VTKQALINQVAKKAHLTKKASKEAIAVFFDEVSNSLAKGEKVVVSGFGTFYVSRVDDKQVVPFGNESARQTVKSHKVINFKVGKPLRKRVW